MSIRGSCKTRRTDLRYLCGLAPELAALCACRALQALGAAMLQANSLAIIALVVPRRSLGRAIGLQGAAQAIGLALGPSVGGLLVAAGGWRLIFFVNVPLGLLGHWQPSPSCREARTSKSPHDLAGHHQGMK
jgi:MFS family permease